MDWKDGSGLSIRYRIRNISKYNISFLLQNELIRYRLVKFENTVLIFLSRIKIDTVKYGTNGTVIRYERIKKTVNFYLLMVGKKDGFLVEVVSRGVVVVRGVDSVVEEVNDVPVVVRGVVVVMSGILGTL